MRILVLGGTRFVGRHVVETLLARGHRVSVLTRGRSPDPLPAAVERLRGDRDLGVEGLAALRGRDWDACVDVSGYLPRQVRPSAELLRRQVHRYLFISAVSVYGDPRQGPVNEATPLMPPAGEEQTEIDGASYGPLKVACERLLDELYGPGAILLRPQVLVGPHDDWHRYTHWLQRADQGGEMLAPGDGSDMLQLLDARDLARFVAGALERELSGAFNLAGPRLSWGHFIREVLGVAKPVWVPAAWLRELDFQQLPLYRHAQGPRVGLMNIDTARARAAGLETRAPELTARDTRAWLRSQPARPSALAPALEVALLARARAGNI